MIIYRATKSKFQDDITEGIIDYVLEKNFKEKLNRRVAEKEKDSWWNSLNYMSNVLQDQGIPDNTGIAIECQIPQTAKRIDFILSGFDENEKNQVVIVELKQWKSAELTDKSGIVRTALGRGLNETSHPAYQAWSYAAMLEDFSETVQEENIGLFPCAYLHNYEEDEVIRNPFYKEYLDKAPVFLKRDTNKLRDFIKQFVKRGDYGITMYRIIEGKIRPSKQLADSLVSMLKGNREFVLVDEQKLIYETALKLTREAGDKNKKVMIIEGGPGTGKSVVAVNLLVEITRLGLLTQYVTKNAAPRAVYQSKLAKTLSKTRFAALFQGSGSFTETKRGQFDALIVDEAHRLNAKSGLYQNMGENQVKEIILAAHCSIFFIDEDQRVTLKDIGTKEEILQWAQRLGAEVHEYELPSQFRCNGSDGYLAFLDNLLQIRETANVTLENINYDFKVFDSVSEMRDRIMEKNQKDNKSRLVAGYCWDWKSKKDPKAMDIEFPQENFAMQWNLSVDGSLWILQKESVHQIGCIHTCQGLELSHVGVIIGNDLIVRNGEVLVDPSKRSIMDASIKGYKKMLKEDPENAKIRIKHLIKNTYRTLMTRGMKGCYVYCTDPETREYFKHFAS
ncbi:MAG: DNA/RNA helicase domain-containing protein [Bacteroidia bacterium]